MSQKADVDPALLPTAAVDLQRPFAPIDSNAGPCPRPCENSLLRRRQATLLHLGSYSRSLRTAAARATTVNCALIGGDRLFTRPRPVADIAGSLMTVEASSCR